MGQNIDGKDSGKCLNLPQNPTVTSESPGSDKYYNYSSGYKVGCQIHDRKPDWGAREEGVKVQVGRDLTQGVFIVLINSRSTQGQENEMSGCQVLLKMPCAG